MGQRYYQPALFDVADMARPIQLPGLCRLCGLADTGLSRLPDGEEWISFAVTARDHLWEIKFGEKVPVGLPGGPLGARVLNWRSANRRTLELVQRRYAAERIGDSDLYKRSTPLLLDMLGEAVDHFGQRSYETRRVRAEVAWYVDGQPQRKESRAAVAA